MNNISIEIRQKISIIIAQLNKFNMKEMNKESDNVFNYRKSSLNIKSYSLMIYGLVLLALSLLFNLNLFTLSSIQSSFFDAFFVLSINLLLFSVSLFSVIQIDKRKEEKSIGIQIIRGAVIGVLAFSASLVINTLIICSNSLISFFKQLVNLINFNLIKDILCNILFNLKDISISLINIVVPILIILFFIKHVKRKIKEDCKFEFRVSLKEEKKEKQIDNKEGKNLSVGFLYKVFP